MPELPEVQTIVRGLREGHAGSRPLPGARIQRVTVRWPRHVAEPCLRAFRRRIKGQRIQDARRRGKYLLFPLDHDTLLIHLKMSGDLRLVTSGTPRKRYDHTIFHLDDGWELRVSDARKFGRVYLLEDPQTVLGSLGPEPLDPAFTARILGERLATRRRLLKPLLLDQTFLAGLGNIYADEALHRARLHPLRRSDSLQSKEVHALWKGIRAALQQGLRHSGASIDWVYQGGGFQNHFRVYRRTGQACHVCRTPIERMVVGQRATHYCPSCQLEEAA
jgi:formamidopyrimidine-DNA glycosylase